MSLVSLAATDLWTTHSKPSAFFLLHHGGNLSKGGKGILLRQSAVRFVAEENHQPGEEIMRESSDMDPRMKYFYVEMDASVMHTMIIPKKFAKMFKGSISRKISLKGPSGIAWHVKMNKFNDTFALRSGWKEFVRANRIDNNDVLFFTYKGNSAFKVIIFDRSGCQKTAPFFAKTTESEEAHDSLIHEVKKEIISPSSDSSDTDESSRKISSGATRERTTGETIICCKRKRRDPVQESSESESESDKGECEHVRKRKTRENNVAKKDSGLYVLPVMTYLTKAQEETANRMIQKTQKDKRSNICTAEYRKTKTRRYISRGWREFVCKNGLKQGDLCLLELRKPDKCGNLTMAVHFDRVSS
ncbi:B3 domain-containing protein Os03g0619600-like [Carex rostrata]